MREIKFRVWDKLYKSWEQDFTIFPNGSLWDCRGYSESWGDAEPRNQYIIMQYTGLKDRRGKEIYGGDVVKFEPNSIEYPEDIFIYEVVWFKQNCGFLFKINNDRYDALDISYQDRLEVIGNIYENPELVKEKR